MAKKKTNIGREPKAKVPKPKPSGLIKPRGNRTGLMPFPKQPLRWGRRSTKRIR